MSASTKLSNSVKALCYLAEKYPEAKSSTEISEHTGVNASKLRKLLSLLAKSGIVFSNKGTTGGFNLAMPPNSISLQQVYCAIEDRKAFHFDVNKNIGNSKSKTELYNNYFLELFADIQNDIERKMHGISLNLLMTDIKNKI